MYISTGIGAQRLDKLQTEYDYQKELLLENWEGDELEITDNQDRAEMKLTLITYIQDRDFKAYKKEREIAMLTAKNNERLEVKEVKKCIEMLSPQKYTNVFGYICANWSLNLFSPFGALAL